MAEAMKNIDATEKRLPPLVFRQALDGLQKTAGVEQTPLPENPTEQDLNVAERALTGDTFFESFSEQFRSNEIMHRRNAMQREDQLHNAPEITPALKTELITVNEAITYHEYFPMIVRDTTDIMRRYATVRATMQSIPNQFRIGEEQADLYLAALNAALQERIAYANTLLADGKLARNVGDVKQLTQLRDSYRGSVALSETSRKALAGSEADKWRQGNALNQRIIALLAGGAHVPGVDKGFLPQMLLIDLLKYKYEEIFAEEKKVVNDPTLQKARARVAQLELRGTATPGLIPAEGQEPLSDVELAEYERLQLLVADRNAYLDRLKQTRREVTQEILSFTDRLATDQMQSAELTTIQHQFGDQFDFAGVSPPNPDRTPAEIQEAMAQHMEERSEFHLLRMDAFFERINDDVLGAGMQEWVEDISNKKGHEAMRRANNALSQLVTALIPETFGIKDKAYESLTLPLNQALGWPQGKEKWEELTSEEQATVLEKSQSVLDAIRAFDRSKIENMRSTVSLIRGMPKAENFQGQEIVEPLPTERVTPANREVLIQRLGGATVYMMLFRQMDADWGSDQPPAGFLGEYASFLRKVNATVDVHIDVGDALMQLKNTYQNFQKHLWQLALLLLGAGVLAGAGGTLLWKLKGPIARTAWKTTKVSARWTIEGMKMAGRTSMELRNLASKIPPSRLRVGKLLGPVGIALIGADLIRVIRRDRRLQALPELDGVLAAIELMEKHGDTDAQRYTLETKYLQNELASLLMQNGTEQLLNDLDVQYPKGSPVPENVVQLKNRLTALQTQVEKSKQIFHKLFPLNDPKYIFTDPKREPGNVGVNLRTVDLARAEGSQFASDLILPSVSKWDPQKNVIGQGGSIASVIADFDRQRADYERLEAEVAMVLP